MNDQPILGFYLLSQSWFAESRVGRDEITDEIMIGEYCEEGGTFGEFAIRWALVGGEDTPRLEAFEDSWGVLAKCRDLVVKLGELANTNPTPKQVVENLLAMGYRDLTQRDRPESRIPPESLSDVAASVLSMLPPKAAQRVRKAMAE